MENQTNQTNSASSPSFINGFFIGLVAGAAGYFLLATKKGKVVRKQLARQAGHGWQELEDALEKSKETSKELKVRAKKSKTDFDKKSQVFKRKATREYQSLKDKVDQAKKRADQMQKELKKAAVNIEKRFFTKNGRSLGK